MQNKVEFLVFMVSFGFFIILMILVAIYIKQIEQFIQRFFENRNARKVAKKLNLIDKGRIRDQIVKSLDDQGCEIYNFQHQVHAFCETPARIGISDKKSVKWCMTCEVILLEDDDQDGGGDGEEEVPPDPPPSFEVKRFTEGLVRNLTKKVK